MLHSAHRWACLDQVYGVTGRLVATLVDEETSPATYSVTWDGEDSEGARGLEQSLPASLAGERHQYRTGQGIGFDQEDAPEVRSNATVPGLNLIPPFRTAVNKTLVMELGLTSPEIPVYPISFPVEFEHIKGR